MIVATAVRDHEIPIAFDLNGNRVYVTSSEMAPATPVLALVPAETNFGVIPTTLAFVECDPSAIVECDPGSGSGGGGLQQPTSNGLWMNRSEIYNAGQYEGWLMGGPEFEVILASEVTTSGGFDDERQCAGEYASATSTNNPGVRHPAYDYNQDNDVWAGLTKLATLELMSSSQIADNGTTFMVWEDDNTACRIRQSGEWVTWAGGVISSAISGARSAIKKDLVGVTLSTIGLLTSTFRMLPSLNSDDLVGWIVGADAIGDSFPSGSHAIFDEQRRIVGNLNLVLMQP